MLKVDQAPEGPVLVKQQFTITGSASTTYAGRSLKLIVDNQLQTQGPAVQPNGIWQVKFLFQQAGNRRLKIAIDSESVELTIPVVTSLPPAPSRLRFINPPQQVEVGQTASFVGEADQYPDGAQLVLRADGQFELARPQVQSNRWQAPVIFGQAGRRLIEVVGAGQDKAQTTVEIVPAGPRPTRLRFTNPPQRLQTGQTVILTGDAEGLSDGTQLLLRADKTYELGRPTVQAGKWQAPIAFNQPGSRLIELIASEQEKAEVTIEVVAPNKPPRPPRVSFTDVPQQLQTEQSIVIKGGAENYKDGDQLVLRVDQTYELSRPIVKNQQWQATIRFQFAGRRLLEIVGSDQDKAQAVITVQAPTSSDLKLYPRSTWTTTVTPADVPNLANPQRITLHHTDIAPTPPVNAGQSAEIERMRTIRNSHVNGNGWSDIGYHYVIMPSGRIYEGRQERKRGAHDVINDGLGVAFDGVYSSQTISQQQYESAIALCTVLCKRYGITDTVTAVPTATADFGTRNLPRICGHRDRVATECPGSEGGRTVRLPDIRQAVNGRV